MPVEEIKPKEIKEESVEEIKSSSNPSIEQINRDTEQKYRFVGNNKLSDIKDVNKLLVDLSYRMDEKHHYLVIPIGLPNSGKSMFIASLLAYAFRRSENDTSCSFREFFDRKVSGIGEILDALDQRATLPSTKQGEFTIIDIAMKTRHDEELVISILDFSGEDLKCVSRDIANMEKDRAMDIVKIRTILDSCVTKPSIFALVTPVCTTAQYREFDRAEDDAMIAFIDYVKEKNANLYDTTKFLMVVSKWDTLNGNVDARTFLSDHRQQLYAEYSIHKNKKSYGLLTYSVGIVVSSTITQINLTYPQNFWHTLYYWCIGKHVLPFWKRKY